MARIRTIKPDFFQSEDVVLLSYRARLTWVGLWTYADDEGRCKDSARLIKGQLWPLEDDVTAKHVEEDLTELAANSKIERYVVGGEKFIQISKWLTHQRISRPTPSRLPAPAGALTESSMIFTEDSVNPHAHPESTETGSHESSTLEREEEREVEVEQEQGKRANAHPLPASFTLTPERAAWAKQNTPAVNAELETAGFIDYWRGEQGKKKDWESTWRNWMRRKQGDAETRGWKPQAQKDIYNPANW